MNHAWRDLKVSLNLLCNVVSFRLLMENCLPFRKNANKSFNIQNPPKLATFAYLFLLGVLIGQDALSKKASKRIDLIQIAGASGSEWLLRGGEWSDPEIPEDPVKLAWRNAAHENAAQLAEFALACLIVGSEIEYGSISLDGFTNPEERLWQAAGIFRMLDGKIPRTIESKLEDFLEKRTWSSPAGGRMMLAGAIYFTTSSDINKLFKIAIEDLESKRRDDKKVGVQLLTSIAPRDPRAIDRLRQVLKLSPIESVEFAAAVSGALWLSCHHLRFYEEFKALRDSVPEGDRKRKLRYISPNVYDGLAIPRH